MEGEIYQRGNGQLRCKLDQVQTEMVSLCMTLVKGLILVRMMILLALFLDGMQDFHRLAQAEDKQQQYQRSGTSRFYPSKEHETSLAQRLRSGPPAAGKCDQPGTKWERLPCRDQRPRRGGSAIQRLGRSPVSQPEM